LRPTGQRAKSREPRLKSKNPKPKRVHFRLSRAAEIPKPVTRAAEKPRETPVLQSKAGDIRNISTAPKNDKSKAESSRVRLGFSGMAGTV
jgi:hypothetical protein